MQVQKQMPKLLPLNPDQKSVLVLEDDPQWQTIVSQLLKKVDSNIQVRCVPTTTRAIELLNEGAHYDLIVADQFLDGNMTGLDFYRHCRTNLNDTSFVMLSGLQNAEFRDLVDKDAESPLFISKSSNFEIFSNLIRAEFQTAGAAAIVTDVNPTEIKKESLFLMAVFSSALALTVSQTHFKSSATIGTSLEPAAKPVAAAPLSIAPLSVPTPKNLILTGRGHHRAEVTSKGTPALPHTGLFANSRLREDMQRVLSRADQINKKVSVK